MVNAEGGRMDEWLCLSSPGRCWELQRPSRTKSAVFVFPWLRFCASICKDVSWRWWVLTGLREVGEAGSWPVGPSFAPLPPQLTAFNISAWFLFGGSIVVKVRHLFFNFPGQHPVVVQRFLCRAGGLLPP